MFNFFLFLPFFLVFLQAKALLPKAKPGETYQARIAPNHLNVFLNLGNLIAKNKTRLEEADKLYRQAISMRPDYTQAYINRGDVLLKLNRTKEAQQSYERALFYDSTNPDIYYNVSIFHIIFSYIIIYGFVRTFSILHSSYIGLATTLLLLVYFSSIIFQYF